MEKQQPVVLVGLKKICGAMQCSEQTLKIWIDKRGFPAWQAEDRCWRAVPAHMEEWCRKQAEERH